MVVGKRNRGEEMQIEMNRESIERIKEQVELIGMEES
jgi:hypothetical protein